MIRLEQVPPSPAPLGLEEIEAPSPRPVPAADEQERRRFHALPRHRRVEFDSEEAFADSTGDFSRALVRVHCPTCRIRRAPLLARATRHVSSDWVWRGISHREPVSGYLCVCPGCHHDYGLQVYTPQ